MAPTAMPTPQTVTLACACGRTRVQASGALTGTVKLGGLRCTACGGVVQPYQGTA